MIRSLLIVAISTLFAACQGCNGGGEEKKAETPLDTIPMLIMQVQKCSRLYTSEYDIRKIVTHSDNTRLKGNILGADINLKMPLSDRSIAIPIEAKVKAYIDLSGFSERNIIKNGKKITIVLPDPQAVLTSTSVDHDNVREYSSTSLHKYSDAEISNFEQQGREAIVKSIPQLSIVDDAQTNAARIIIPMIVSLGYDESDITISFRKDFNHSKINILTDNSTIEK